MSKRKARRKRSTTAQVRSYKKRRIKLMMLVGVVLILSIWGIIFAQWSSVTSTKPIAAVNPAPQPITPVAPSPTPALLVKDYIYAGGRLVATEAQGSTSAQGDGVVAEPGDPSSQPPPIIPTNIAVWRPWNATWYILNTNGTLTEQAWGVIGDKPVQGNYDGDTKTDFAVFRPSDSTWYILRSTDAGVTALQWGISTDEPVPGDYDGDGVTDAAVRRGSTWLIRYSSDSTGSTVITQQWGTDTDLAVPGDYDGDGRTDIATFRPADATWSVLKSSSPADAPEMITQQWGESGDLPQDGDFDGDNITDFAIFRPSDTVWRILSSFDGMAIEQQWGLSSDKPAVGDYDGDGKTDIGVVRPRVSATDNNSTWYILKSSDSSLMSAQWGLDGDLAVPGKYNRNLLLPVCFRCD